jgi:alkylhydroperoxidase/carboxymuconolactone decarboxylase family protein YurZ
MKNRTVTHAKPPPPAWLKLPLSPEPSVLGAAGSSKAPLSQKDRTFFRLAIAIGMGSEPEVRAHTRRAIEAGWTVEEITYAARLAAKSFASSEVFTAAMWVEEALKK